MPPVREIMSAPVFAVRATDEVAHARNEMLRRGVSHLAVVDEDERLVGFLSLSEIVRRAARRPVGRKHPFAAPVRDVMETRPTRLAVSTNDVEAARRLVADKVTAAPVLDGERLAGVVSVEDLLRALAPRAKGRMHVRDVMRRSMPSVHRHKALAAVLQTMDEEGVGEIAVVEGQAFVTERTPATPERVRDPVHTGFAAQDFGIVGVVSIPSLAAGAWLGEPGPSTRGKRIVEARRSGDGRRLPHTERVEWVAEDLMVRDVRGVSADDDAASAARELVESHHRGLAVLGEEAGWVDRQELLAAFTREIGGAV